MIAAAASMILAASCGQNGKKSEKNAETTDSKTLVAYFSATGTTEAIAKTLAGVTGGTLYEIKPEVKYTAEDLDWTVKTSRSTLEMQDKTSRPAIVKDLADASKYETIYIGFPVWWYTAPTIINTFLEAYDFSGKTVIPFATSGGSGIGDVDKYIAPSVPGAVVKEGKRLGGTEDIEALKIWTEGMNL